MQTVQPPAYGQEYPMRSMTPTLAASFAAALVTSLIVTASPAMAETTADFDFGSLFPQAAELLRAQKAQECRQFYGPDAEETVDSFELDRKVGEELKVDFAGNGEQICGWLQRLDGGSPDPLWREFWVWLDQREYITIEPEPREVWHQWLCDGGSCDHWFDKAQAAVAGLKPTGSARALLALSRDTEELLTTRILAISAAFRALPIRVQAKALGLDDKKLYERVENALGWGNLRRVANPGDELPDEVGKTVAIVGPGWEEPFVGSLAEADGDGFTVGDREFDTAVPMAVFVGSKGAETALGGGVEIGGQARLFAGDNLEGFSTQALIAWCPLKGAGLSLCTGAALGGAGLKSQNSRALQAPLNGSFTGTALVEGRWSPFDILSFSVRGEGGTIGEGGLFLAEGAAHIRAGPALIRVSLGYARLESLRLDGGKRWGETLPGQRQVDAFTMGASVHF